MMVLVKVRVEVDPTEYNAEYGTEDPAFDIRQQITNLAVDAVDIATKHLQPHAVRKVEAA